MVRNEQSYLAKLSESENLDIKLNNSTHPFSDIGF